MIRARVIGMRRLLCLGYRGFARTRRHALTSLLAAVIAGHLLTVALTFADWDGRFLLYVLPAIGVLAARGVPVAGFDRHVRVVSVGLRPPPR